MLWHEATKTSAIAMLSGSFRHGPQEVLVNDINCFVILDQNVSYNHDLQLIEDLKKLNIATFPLDETIFTTSSLESILSNTVDVQLFAHYYIGA